MMVAEKFREIVARKEVIYEDQKISFTISIGVASINGNTENISDIEDVLKWQMMPCIRQKQRGVIVFQLKYT